MAPAFPRVTLLALQREGARPFGIAFHEPSQQLITWCSIALNLSGCIR